MSDKQSESEELTHRQVFTSVVAAAFGVQSSKNRERDFTRGNPVAFIVAGLLFTVLFVLTLVGAVYLVL